MASRTTQALILGAAVLLAGCSYTSDVLWPSLSGDVPAGSTKTQIPPSPGEKAGGPTFGPALTAGASAPAEVFVPTAIAPLTPTGTIVGQKVATLHAQLQALVSSVSARAASARSIRGQTIADSERYHGTVAAITTRLQLGTTPGNPVLVQQWNEAQGDLDRLSSDIAQMNTLANGIASDASQASYLLNAAQATYGLSGAIDEDHRQLATIEDETSRTQVSIDRLLKNVSDDVARQTAYVGNERANLTTLAMAVKNGQLYGVSLTNRAYEASLQQQPAPLPLAGAEPLVVIRFDRANVRYRDALYTAVSKALTRRPQASFAVVAVAAANGSAAQTALNEARSRRNADKVVQSLTDMGLPPGRVQVTATTNAAISTNEVEIFAR